VKYACNAVLAAVVLLNGGVAFAQKYTEKYGDWKEKKNREGITIVECSYTATDGDGKVVRQNTLFFFPNDPITGNTDASRYWVYWYNPQPKGKGVIWGRCPTPRHPMYKKWTKDKGGIDLWQVIDPKVRIMGETNVNKLKADDGTSIFGATFSTMQMMQPTIVPGENNGQPIECINFNGGISRYMKGKALSR